MHNYTFRVHTDARYNGMPVVVATDDMERMVVLAWGDAADTVTLAAVTVDPATPEAPYRVEGDTAPVKTLRDAAHVAVTRATLRDEQ
jgi:hypothetical protein